MRAVAAMGVMYLCGALATLGYNRLMVKTSQKVIREIRKRFICTRTKLPLRYFDAHTHGELMSRFTNDVDAVQEAMNNSFAMIIQSFMMLFGTVIMMMVLSIRLSLIVVVFLIVMFVVIRLNGKHSKNILTGSRRNSAKLTDLYRKWQRDRRSKRSSITKQKDYARFCELSENFRKQSTNALSFAGMMIPTIVSLSYLNYAVSACAGGLLCNPGTDGFGKSFGISGICAPECNAVKSVYPAGQFPVVCAFRCGTHFDMMDEQPEVDEGNVHLCHVVKNADGTLTECEQSTPDYAWKVPENGGFRYVELKGDVRFQNVVFGYTDKKRVLNGISLLQNRDRKSHLWVQPVREKQRLST